MVPLSSLPHVENWIFDLDNSLYPASANLFDLIDARMASFIEQRLGCGHAEARRLQKHWFHAHGTTLAGLMAEHGVRPAEFLDHVHDIDLARISADPAVGAALARLPGRKFVFTNGDAAYAARVLDKLGLAASFDGVHDIHAMEYRPKPDPAAYAGLCAAHAIDPDKALFLDDMARNLAPAKALGMVTIWLDNGSEQGGSEQGGSEQGPPCDAPAFIDRRIEDIGLWLEEVAP